MHDGLTVQLTRAADYAIRVMIHLAGLPLGAWESQSRLAEEVECPPQFLSKVLQRLTRAGLVVSHRGNAGGFEVPEARRRTSMLDVVEAIEGPIRLNVCVGGGCGCSRCDWCPAHKVWVAAQSALTDVLKSAVIGEMVEARWT